MIAPHSPSASRYTQLTMRTFHIGGAASRAAVAQRRSQVRWAIGFNATMRYVTNGKGELVVIPRSVKSSSPTRTAASVNVTRCPTARR